MAFARAVNTMGLSLVMSFLGIYIVETRGYPAWSYGVIALVGAARASYSQVLAETVRKLPDGSKIMADYSDALFMRWMDYESGRWRPPTAPVGSSKSHHGDR